MAPLPDKPFGLGVLKSFDKLETILAKVRNALAGTPNVALARAEARDLTRELKKSRRDAKKTQKEMASIVKSLQKWWMKNKKQG
jgi:hypothetical protein